MNSYFRLLKTGISVPSFLRGSSKVATISDDVARFASKGDDVAKLGAGNVAWPSGAGNFDDVAKQMTKLSDDFAKFAGKSTTGNKVNISTGVTATQGGALIGGGALAGLAATLGFSNSGENTENTNPFIPSSVFSSSTYYLIILLFIFMVFAYVNY